MEDFEEILDKFNDSRNKIMFSKVKESLLSIFDNECFNGEFYINNLKDGIKNNNEKFLLNNSFNGELNSCIDIIEKCFIYNYTNPIKSKKNIIRVFSNMYEDGTFKDKWSCLTKKYEINDCLYDLLWIVYVLIDYIKVTNDFEILNFEIKFVSDNDLKVKFSNIYHK